METKYVQQCARNSLFHVQWPTVTIACLLANYARLPFPVLHVSSVNSDKFNRIRQLILNRQTLVRSAQIELSQNEFRENQVRRWSRKAESV